MVDNIHTVWHQALSVGLIASKLHVFTPDDDPLVARSLMDKERWDFAGFALPGLKGASSVVQRKSLSGDSPSWKESTTPIAADRLVAKQTPIREAIDRIVRRDILYVIGRHGVDQVVTRADLNKHEVKMMLFGTISSLETKIVECLRKKDVSEKDLEACLKPKRYKESWKKYEELRTKNEDIDFLECLDLCDKRDVLLRLNYQPYIDVCGGKGKLEKFFKRVEKVRNSLAHASDPDQQKSWEQILDLLRTSEALLRIEADQP